MKRKKTVLGFLILMAVASGFTGWARAQEPEKYVLDNGMTVLLLENHRAPVVSMMVWVKAGSGSETEGEHGLAHLLEHMMFKGTTTRGPGEIAREVEGLGGRTNAFTSYDETAYYIDMASRFADQGLEILGDMVLNPALDPKEFQKEKEVVIEEIKMGEDRPQTQLSEALFEEAFKVHPYGRPIIGFEKSVRGFTPDTLKGFFLRWYRPDNMILIVAGDFDPLKIKPVVAKTFGRPMEGRVEEAAYPSEPEQKELRIKILKKDVNAARFSLAFHITAFNDPETPTLDLLSEILGGGRTSRLYRKVKRDQELVHAVWTGSYTPLAPGLMVIGGQADTDKINPAVQAVMAEIEALKKGPIDPEELERVKLDVEASFLRDRETMSGEARNAANFEALAGDVRAKDRYLADLKKVTAEDIQKAARKYLHPGNLTVAVLLPEKDPDLPTEKSLTQAVEQGEASSRANRLAPQEFTLENGARLIVKTDHSLPLVAIRAAFLGGVRYENEKNNGINYLLAEVWDRAAQGKTPDQWAQAVENMAADINSFSGRNSFGLTAEFLSRYLDPGLDLFAELLTRPALDPAEVEKAKPNVLAAIEKRQDNLLYRAQRLFAKDLYQDHPYRFDVMGEPETIKTLTAEDLRQYYDRFARPRDMVITVVGDVNAARVKDRLNALLADWKGAVDQKPEIAGPKPLTGPKETVDRVDKAQSHLIYGFPAAGLESPDRYALEVLDAVLSGMGGRLFVELRDKQSLAYSVSSFYSPGLNTGSFGYYMGFDPEKLAQARKGFQDILKDITEKPVSNQELEDAKKYILGNFEIAFQSNSDQAADLTYDVLYGLGLDYREKYVRGINQVTAEDVLKVAQKYFIPQKSVEILVGKQG